MVCKAECFYSDRRFLYLAAADFKSAETGFSRSFPHSFPRIFNPRVFKYKDFQSVNPFFLFVNRLAYYLLRSARRNAFIRITDPYIWLRRISNPPKREAFPHSFPRIFNPRVFKYKDFQSVKSFSFFVNRLAYYLLRSARRNVLIRITDPYIWPRRISSPPKQVRRNESAGTVLVEWKA